MHLGELPVSTAKKELCSLISVLVHKAARSFEKLLYECLTMSKTRSFLAGDLGNTEWSIIHTFIERIHLYTKAFNATLCRLIFQRILTLSFRQYRPLMQSIFACSPVLQRPNGAVRDARCHCCPCFSLRHK